VSKEHQVATERTGRWTTFGVLCLAGVMVIIDGAVVNVALPSIKIDLHFSDVQLVWVVNAYSLAFSSFVLLGGRLADLFGQRRVFLLGIALFTAASAACGLADTQAQLIGARAVQGLGGAIVSSVSLSLIVTLFTKAPERVKAMGIYSFASVFGGAFGLSLGGTLISVLNWHWIFLINIPIGVLISAFCVVSLAEHRDQATIGRLDFAGAVSITVSSLLAVYAIVNANDVGWSSAQTLILFACSFAGLILFLRIEARVSFPLVPLDLFRRRNLMVGSAISMLLAFTAGGWILMAALYLQIVLKCSPEQVGLAFLPSNLSGAVVSLGLSTMLVTRFGIRPILATGLLLIAGGCVFLARAPVDGSVAMDVLPAMLLDGVGTGLVASPMLLAAINGTVPAESGLVSGVVNAAGMIAGTLGLAVLAAAASAHTRKLVREGVSFTAALDRGYHAAFSIGAILLVAASISTLLLRIEQDEAVRMAHPAPNDSSASV
jgi:EmrB/QacA subfamily drug resistance transporter